MAELGSRCFVWIKILIMRCGVKAKFYSLWVAEVGHGLLRVEVLRHKEPVRQLTEVLWFILKVNGFVKGSV